MAEATGALWRRAFEALAQAFDGSREADDPDTVFQTQRAQTLAGSAEARNDPEPAPPPIRPPEETLQ